MKTIWKFPLVVWKFPLVVDDQQQIELPAGAQPLTVQIQGGVPCLWALVDPRAERTLVTVRMYDTGEIIRGTPGQYIGTVQLHGGSLSHVFVDTTGAMVLAVPRHAGGAA